MHVEGVVVWRRRLNLPRGLGGVISSKLERRAESHGFQGLSSG